MADPNDPNQSSQQSEESSGSEQINIARELNSVLEQVSARLERIQKITQTQADFMTQMTQSFSVMQENMESMTGNAQDMSSSFQEAAESAIDQFSKENLETIGDSVEKITDAYKDASDVQREALKTASSTVSSMGSITKSINEDMKRDTSAINKALSENSKSLFKFGNNSKNINEEVKGFVESIKELKSQIIGIVFSLGQKIKSAISMGFTLVKNLSSFVGGMIGAAAKFAKFAVTVPFTITKAAVNIGNTLRRDIVEVIQTAQEALKEKFDMDSTIGEGIRSMTSRGKGMLLAFQKPSSELVKLFGFGASGIASMIGFLGENIEAMGHFSEMFGRSLGNNMPKFKAFTRMVKGFGFSSEDVAYLAQDAAVNLKDINVRMAELGVTLTSTSKEFGLDRKRLSKNFMILRKDITQFGHLSDEEIARTTARLTQMKVKLEDAAAVFKKFSTFEDAANSVAMLSQTFGMNLDAMDIIQAKNPEDIIEMFRTSMLETGRSFEDLNRFEKELMAQHTGMSAESLKGLMHYRDIGLTYEEARKRMESEKPTAKQMKALKELNSAIKEVQKVMNFDSPFQAFIKGLTNNVALSGELRGTLTSLSGGYQAIYEYAAKMDPNTWSGLIKPIKLIIDIMSNILRSDAFKGGLVSAMSTIADFAAEMFGATKGDVILSKLETNVSIAMQKGGKFYGKGGKQRIEEFKKLMLKGLEENLSLKNLVDMEALKKIKDPRKLIQEINKYKQSIDSENVSQINLFDDYMERSSNEIFKKFDKEDEATNQKKKGKKLSTSAKSKANRLSEGLLEIMQQNKDNLGKLATLSLRIAGAVIKSAAIGFTALLKVINNGMEKLDESGVLDSDTNMIEDLLHFKPGEFADLGSAIGDAFKEFWEKRQNTYSITGWIIDGITVAFGFVIGIFVDTLKEGVNEIMGKTIFEKSSSSMLRESRKKKYDDKSGSMSYGASAIEKMAKQASTVGAGDAIDHDFGFKGQNIADVIVALRAKAEKIQDKKQQKSVLAKIDKIERKFIEQGPSSDLALQATSSLSAIGPSGIKKGSENLLDGLSSAKENIENFKKKWAVVSRSINKSILTFDVKNNKSNRKINRRNIENYFVNENLDWFSKNFYAQDLMNYLGSSSELINKIKYDTGSLAGAHSKTPDKKLINKIISGLEGFDHPYSDIFLKTIFSKLRLMQERGSNLHVIGSDKEELNNTVLPAKPLTTTDATNPSQPVNQATNDLISDMFMNRMKGMSLLNSNFDIMKNLLSSVQYPTATESSMSNVEELNVASYNAGSMYSESSNITIERERRMTKEEAAQFKEKLMKTKEKVAASELEVDSNVILDTGIITTLMKKMAGLGLVNELTKNENTQGVMRLSAASLDSATFNVGNYSATMKETYED